MKFESGSDNAAWRAGIFHGINTPATFGQTNEAIEQIRQMISESVAQGIELGADRAADKIEKRYATGLTILFAAILVTAAATTVTAVLVASGK